MIRRWFAHRFLANLTALLIMAAALVGANFLQSDTSLQMVESTGVLRICVPASFPPLVSGDSKAPGFDVAVLEEIAKRMNLRLSLNVNYLMGRDFNPRNWQITRASCEIIAGGVVTSGLTASFLETLPTGIVNGWVLLAPTAMKLAEDQTIAVYPGFSGLDRLALSSYLRGQGLKIMLVASIDDLQQGLKAGRFAAVVASNLDILQIEKVVPDWASTWLPQSLGRFSFGFGLWRGDVTLKRKVLAIYRTLEAEGFIDAQKKRYGLK